MCRHNIFLQPYHKETCQQCFLKERFQSLIIVTLERNALSKTAFSIRIFIGLFALLLLIGILGLYGCNLGLHLCKRDCLQSFGMLQVGDKIFCPLSGGEASLLHVTKIHTNVKVASNLPIYLEGPRYLCSQLTTGKEVLLIQKFTVGKTQYMKHLLKETPNALTGVKKARESGL